MEFHFSSICRTISNNYNYSSKPEKPETQLSTFDQDQVNISVLPDRGLNNLLKLDYAYEAGDIEKK